MHLPLSHLQVGAKVRLTSGPGKGYLGTVVGKSNLGNYAVELPCTREGSACKGKKQVHYALGPWWVNTAIAGAWPRLPLVNVGKPTWRKDSVESSSFPPAGARIERLWHDGAWYGCTVAQKTQTHVVLWYPETSEKEKTLMTALVGKWRFRTPPLGSSIERLWHDGVWYPAIVRACDGVTLSLYYAKTNELEQVTLAALQGQWRIPKSAATGGDATAASAVSESVSVNGKTEQKEQDEEDEDLMSTD